MVVADFRDGSTMTYTKTLFQHDKGQRLNFEGLEIPENTECHFSNDQDGGVSYAVKIQNGSTSVKIPDVFLATGQYIHAWIYARLSSPGTKGKINYHLDVAEDDPNARIIIDSAEGSKKGYDNSTTLFHVTIPVKRRPLVLRAEDAEDTEGGEDVPQAMEYTVDNESMQVNTLGNDGTGKPSVHGYLVDDDNLILY